MVALGVNFVAGLVAVAVDDVVAVVAGVAGVAGVACVWWLVLASTLWFFQLLSERLCCCHYLSFLRINDYDLQNFAIEGEFGNELKVANNKLLSKFN